jgi:F-type H+-transporting ATPase subunit alpha
VLSDVRSAGKDILDTLSKDKAISKDLEARLTEYLTAFNRNFAG